MTCTSLQFESHLHTSFAVYRSHFVPPGKGQETQATLLRHPTYVGFACRRQRYTSADHEERQRRMVRLDVNVRHFSCYETVASQCMIS
jgi:hypothetical protein